MPLGMSAGALAKKLNVRLISEQTGVTPDAALRLATFFQTSPEFWMNMHDVHEVHYPSRVRERKTWMAVTSTAMTLGVEMSVHARNRIADPTAVGAAGHDLGDFASAASRGVIP